MSKTTSKQAVAAPAGPQVPTGVYFSIKPDPETLGGWRLFTLVVEPGNNHRLMVSERELPKDFVMSVAHEEIEADAELYFRTVFAFRHRAKLSRHRATTIAQSIEAVRAQVDEAEARFASFMEAAEDLDKVAADASEEMRPVYAARALTARQDAAELRARIEDCARQTAQMREQWTGFLDAADEADRAAERGEKEYLSSW